MDQKFANGTVVMLRSGGPTMTVVGFGEYDYKTNVYLCRWFDAKHNPKTDSFGEAEIEPVDQGRPSARFVKVTRS